MALLFFFRIIKSFFSANNQRASCLLSDNLKYHLVGFVLCEYIEFPCKLSRVFFFFPSFFPTLMVLKSTIFDKIVGTKLRCLSIYRPMTRYSAEAPNFVSWTLGPPTLRQGWEEDHALEKASTLQCMLLTKLRHYKGAIFRFCSN